MKQAQSSTSTKSGSVTHVTNAIPLLPAPQGANARQVGGNHYSAQGGVSLQHWDVVSLFNLDYFQGQITRYLFRWRDKNGVQDLEKAQHFLEKYIELQRATQPRL